MAASRISGESVLQEMYDLIRRRLPDVAPNDPARSTLTEAACVLADRLACPHLGLVTVHPLGSRRASCDAQPEAS